MLKLGEINELIWGKTTEFGDFLTDPSRQEEVLLPKKYVPKDWKKDTPLKVFLYTDSEDRRVATTLSPSLVVGQWALLEVKEVTAFGSFLSWGLDKDLFFPFSEQKGGVKKGDRVLVTLKVDESTGRLYASAKRKALGEGKVLLQEGQEVHLIVADESDLGYQVIIDQRYLGLVYKNTVFQPLKKGDTTRGFIETLRPDGKIDVALQRKGYAKVVDAQDLLWEQIRRQGGTLFLTDDSSPEEIYQQLQMSKKVFKKSLGALYKQKKVRIEEDRIVLS